jgi:hypothetical protein
VALSLPESSKKSEKAAATKQKSPLHYNLKVYHNYKKQWYKQQNNPNQQRRLHLGRNGNRPELERKK